ncbi:hypothetical protein [Edwardsiella tarda]|uniref:hypothetical protein n=1 Tax=Edwardsiella tarda TaxID=636 RepID=UPI003B512E3B
MKDKIDDSFEITRLEEDFRMVFLHRRPQTEADAREMQMQLKQLVAQLEQRGCVLPNFNREPVFQSIDGDPFPVHSMEDAIQQAYRPVYDKLSRKLVEQGQKDWLDTLERARRYDSKHFTKQKN